MLAPATACSLLAGCGIYSLLNKTIIVISDLKDSRASLWCDSLHQKLNYPEWLKIKQQQRRHLDTAGKLLTWMKMCSFLKICFNNAMLIAKLQTFQGLSVSTGRKAGFWHVRWLEESPVLIIYWIQWNHSYFSTFLEPCINQNTSVKKNISIYLDPPKDSTDLCPLCPKLHGTPFLPTSITRNRRKRTHKTYWKYLVPFNRLLMV